MYIPQIATESLRLSTNDAANDKAGVTPRSEIHDTIVVNPEQDEGTENKLTKTPRSISKRSLPSPSGTRTGVRGEVAKSKPKPKSKKQQLDYKPRCAAPTGTDRKPRKAREHEIPMVCSPLYFFPHALTPFPSCRQDPKHHKRDSTARKTSNRRSIPQPPDLPHHPSQCTKPTRLEAEDRETGEAKNKGIVPRPTSSR